MALGDVWGNSWGDSWGAYWRSAEEPPTPPAVRFQMIDIVDGEDRRISRRDRSSALRKNLRDAVKAVSARTAKGEPVEVPPVEVVHVPAPERPAIQPATNVVFLPFPVVKEPAFDEEIAILLMAA
jgi:hypothetical protein